MAIKNALAIASLGGVLLWSSAIQAAAPVEDRNSKPASGESLRLADLFYQMQQMQQEIMEMRGLLEEQSYRIRRLEKQRLEDYENFERRMQQSSSSSRNSSASKPRSSSVASSSSKPRAAATGSASAAVATSRAASSTSQERESYQSAFQMLKKQQLAEAEQAFEDFLREYPEGKYSSNAYYWLGELYLTDGELPKAEKTFSTLVDRYPDFRKTPDSTFKLAKIHYQQGDKKQAEALLNKIVNDYSQSSPSTAKLATAYLDKHFR